MALHHKPPRFCDGNRWMGLGTLPETIVCEHSSVCHPKIQVKGLSFNEEVKCEHDSETPPPSVSHCSFKMDRGTVENFFLENMDILRTEEESKHLDCYQCSAACHHNLFDVMEIDQYLWNLWLAHLERDHQCSKVYMQDLDQHMPPSRRLFQGRPCIFE